MDFCKERQSALFHFSCILNSAWTECSEDRSGTCVFGSLPAEMEHIGGDRSSAMSQAVVASGANSPNNLLQLQPRNQKVCSSARQTAPWVEQEGAGRRQIAPCRGVGAAGMGKGQGVEPVVLPRGIFCVSAVCFLCLSGEGAVQMCLLCKMFFPPCFCLVWKHFHFSCCSCIHPCHHFKCI